MRVSWYDINLRIYYTRIVAPHRRIDNPHRCRIYYSFFFIDESYFRWTTFITNQNNKILDNQFDAVFFFFFLVMYN